MAESVGDFALPTARDIILRTVVTHTITYFIAGVAAFVLWDYATLMREMSDTTRPVTDPIVMAGPLFQPIRGVLFGLVFYLLRDAFFARPGGWLGMWLTLLVVGVIGPFGAPPGSIEGLIYTRLPLSIHLKTGSEIVVQSLLLSMVLCYWVNHRDKKWLNWTMGVAFVIVIVLPVLGLLTTQSPPDPLN